MQQHAGAIVLHDLALQTLPHIRREAAGFRQAGGECLDDLLIAHAAGVEDHPPALAEFGARCGDAAPGFLSLEASAAGTAQFDAHRVADVTAGAFAAHDKPVPMQLHIGVLNGVAGAPQ